MRECGTRCALAEREPHRLRLKQTAPARHRNDNRSQQGRVFAPPAVKCLAFRTVCTQSFPFPASRLTGRMHANIVRGPPQADSESFQHTLFRAPAEGDQPVPVRPRGTVDSLLFFPREVMLGEGSRPRLDQLYIASQPGPDRCNRAKADPRPVAERDRNRCAAAGKECDRNAASRCPDLDPGHFAEASGVGRKGTLGRPPAEPPLGAPLVESQVCESRQFARRQPVIPSRNVARALLHPEDVCHPVTASAPCSSSVSRFSRNATVQYPVICRYTFPAWSTTSASKASPSSVGLTIANSGSITASGVR